MIDNSPKKLENVTHILFTNGYVFGVNNDVPDFYYDAQYLMSPSNLQKYLEEKNPKIPVFDLVASIGEEMARIIDQEIIRQLMEMATNLNETKIC